MRISFTCLASLMVLWSTPTEAQIQPTLGTARAMPEDYWGLNGSNTINDGHGWNTINTPVNDLNITALSAVNLRYPGGAVANYWDWRSGYLMKRLPSGYSFPDNLEARQRNFWNPSFSWSIEKPDNRLREFSRSFLKTGGRPVFDINILSSDFPYQLAMLYHARELNIPVRYLELGNEFYDGNTEHVTRFPDVAVYTAEALSWAQQFKNDPNLGGALQLEIAAVGAISNNNDPGRERLWLDGLLENLALQEQTAGPVIDAITLHSYGGARSGEFQTCGPASFDYTNDSEAQCVLQTMLSQPFMIMDNLENTQIQAIQNAGKAVWMTEYNLFDAGNYYVHGTWAHALYVSTMTLEWLKSEAITKVNMHTLLGNAAFSAVFADFDAGPGGGSGFDDLGAFASPGVLPTNPWQYTALGNAMSLIGPAAARASSVSMIDFSQLGLPAIHPSYAPNQPVLLGVRFEELVPNTATTRDQELIILNLGFDDQSVNVTGLLDPGPASVQMQLIEGGPFTHVTGNASQGSIITPNLINQELLLLDNNLQPLNNVVLPGYSIIRIRAIYNDPLSILPSVSSICTTPDPIEPWPCAQDISTISLLLSGGAPPYQLTCSEPAVTLIQPTIDFPNVGYLQLPVGYSVSGLTTITVTVTDNINVTADADVLVNETPDLVITSGIDPVYPCEFPLDGLCRGDNLTFSANAPGATNYIWTPTEGTSCQQCSDVTITPSHSENYTVYVSNGTCFVSNDADPIYLQVQPVIDRITPQFPMVCTPASSNATDDHTLDLTVILEDPQGTMTYAWTDPAGTPIGINSPVCTLQAFGSAEGNYFVTVTSPGGCSSQHSVFVNKINCCYSTDPADFNIFPDDSLASTTTNSGAFGAANVYINGTLHIDEDAGAVSVITNFEAFDFDGKHVYMGEDSRLIVDKGVNLSVRNGSIFENCSADLWYGIQASENGSIVYVDGGSSRNIFSDATNALDLSNGVQFRIVESDFTNNRVHTWIHNYFNTIKDPFSNSISPVRNNIFNCPQLNTFHPDKTLQCIKLEQTEGILIGQGGTGNSNSFTDANYGVYAVNSSFELWNNTFTKIQPFPLGNGARPDAAAVYARSANIHDDRKIILGGDVTQNFKTNHFDNNFQSIYILSSYDLYIGNNDFYTSVNATNIRVNDISVYRNNYAAINIAFNNFTDFNRAIYLYDTWRDVNHINVAFIDSNDFEYTSGLSGSFSESAIVASDPVMRKSETPWLFIRKNTITQARIGVFTRNIDKPAIGQDGFGNTLYFDVGNSQSVNKRYYGIWTEDCPGIQVIDNNISNFIDMQDLPDFRAIMADNCQAGFIQCNYINSISRGLVFKTNCELTIPRYNYFANYWHGIEIFDQNTIVTGIMGEMVLGTSDYIPFDNEWLYVTPENPDKYKVFNNSSLLGVDWYYKGVPIFDEPFYPHPANQGITSVNTGLSGDGNCNDLEWVADREMSIGRLINDSLSFANSNESYQAKMNLYNLMESDSSLLNTGSLSDVPYQEYYNELVETNIGIFNEVNNLISDTSGIGLATISNTTINDTNTVEYYRKSVNTIFLSSYLETAILTSADSLFLHSVAYGEYSVYGDAKFDALATLGEENTYERYTNSNRTSNNEIPYSDFNYSISPNPAYSHFNISGGNHNIVSLVMFDSKNILVTEVPKHDISKSVSVSTLPTGWYAIEIRGPNEICTLLKLLVIK